MTDRRTAAMPASQSWRVSRDVPLALIVSIVGGLAMQAGGGLWWLSHLENRVTEQERRVGRLELSDVKQDDLAREIRESLARLDERSRQTADFMVRINRLLEPHPIDRSRP